MRNSINDIIKNSNMEIFTGNINVSEQMKEWLDAIKNNDFQFCDTDFNLLRWGEGSEKCMTVDYLLMLEKYFKSVLKLIDIINNGHIDRQMLYIYSEDKINE